MAKKYIVTLSEKESETLKDIISKRNNNSQIVKRAFTLLACCQNNLNWNDKKASETYGLSIRTIERLRQRFVEEGLDIALNGKTREVFKEKVLDGRVESHLLALRCSPPPDGYNKWTLRLLADKMVELEYCPHICHESVRQILKKRN